MKLEGRTCIVTGAGRGIGEAITHRFADEGATVAVLDLDLDAARGVAAVANGSAHRCDVSDRASVEAAVAEVLETHGRVDVLVNNAGVALAGPSETFSDADWDASIGIMQTGVFLCSQVVGRHMIERKRARSSTSARSTPGRRSRCGLPTAPPRPPWSR